MVRSHDHVHRAKTVDVAVDTEGAGGDDNIIASVDEVEFLTPVRQLLTELGIPHSVDEKGKFQWPEDESLLHRVFQAPSWRDRVKSFFRGTYIHPRPFDVSWVVIIISFFGARFRQIARGRRQCSREGSQRTNSEVGPRSTSQTFRGRSGILSF